MMTGSLVGLEMAKYVVQMSAHKQELTKKPQTIEIKPLHN